MSHFVRCDRCELENVVLGTVTLPPGWVKVLNADLCEACSVVVRDFIHFKPSYVSHLPTEPVPDETMHGPASDKLFETEPEVKEEKSCVTPADSSAALTMECQNVDATVPTPPVGTMRIGNLNQKTDIPTNTEMTKPNSPELETSIEERSRTRKKRKKLLGQDAILPDKRNISTSGAPTA